jgi:putative polyhydroxyalkanoate system protein
MNVSVNHSLTTAEARKRLDQFAGKLKTEFPGQAQDIKQTWSGDTCTVSGSVMGFSLKCELNVSPNSVTATGDVPLFARPFQGKIEAAVKNGLEKALANG